MTMISRRDVIRGISAAVPLAAVLADPMLAAAAAGTLQSVSVTTEDGRKVTGSLALPAETPAAAVLLIHEWWGLNDQIKSVAAEFAEEGYVALALDLYDGRVATAGDRDAARAYMQAVDPALATGTVTAWVDWLKRHQKSTRKVGTVGWCFGGGWSLATSLAVPVEATVIYYGRVNRTAAEHARLEGPVLGHFGTLDQFINRKMVGGFETEMKAAGKTFTTYWYEADHGFANPSGGGYDEADAKLAWERTLAFFAKHL